MKELSTTLTTVIILALIVCLCGIPIYLWNLPPQPIEPEAIRVIAKKDGCILYSIKHESHMIYWSVCTDKNNSSLTAK